MAMPRDKAMYMVLRADWEALPPKYRFKVELPVDTLLMRYSGTDPCTDDESCQSVLKAVQKSQMEDKNLPDIMWNFMVGGDGKVYEGTGWKNTTSKEDEYLPYDFKNYDLVYIGKNKEHVTADMRWAMRKFIEHGRRLDKIKEGFIFVGDQEIIDNLYT